jgi:hypothetical protein
MLGRQVAGLAKAYVPLRFELGEAFQFDWSEVRMVIGGIWRKILASHLKLCASRAFVVHAHPTQSHAHVFRLSLGKSKRAALPP